MNLEEVTAKFEALESKAVQLITLCEHLKHELRLAEEENNQLKLAIKKQADEIRGLTKKQETLRSQNNFQNIHKIGKLVHSLTADSKEATDLKVRLDEYIQELDRCIAHLSK